METEHCLSGYCRVLDQSRIVSVLTVDGKLEEVDCCYGNCPHEPACPIAQNIRQLND